MAKSKSRAAATAEPSDTAPGAEYTVVARRYRPQQFDDLVGQEPVAQALKNAIQSNRIAHAYLFTGARGTGKTSTARILAKALNCEKGPTYTPCDQCEICKGITTGDDVDVLEIDGASNNKAEEARELRQNIGTRPTRSRYKVYIIDEVHMLSTAAFNVLLKTLEEPPPHVKFIFATTEVQKIPITILSRCQRFNFSGITSAKIAARLKQVVAAEGMLADDDALMLLARRAGGSMRDAQSLLDQLLSFAGEKLTIEKIHQLLGTATDDRILALADAIAAKDATKAFELLAEYAEIGLQLGELIDQLIEYWRTLMVMSCAGKEFGDVSLADANRAKAYAHSQAISLDTILAALDVLTTTKSRLRGGNHGLVLLEMAVLRLIRLDELVSVSQLSNWLSQGQAGGVSPVAASRQAPAADAGKKNSITAPQPISEGKHAVPTPIGAINGSVNLEEIWTRVRDNVGPILGGNLASAGLPAILGPKTLVLRFALRYTHHHDYCAEPNSILRIQDALKTVTGQEWTVRIEKESGSELPAAAQTQAIQGVTNRSRDEDARKLPLIGRAIDKLGARLLKLDDGFGSEGSIPVEGETEPQES
jgi:DNA polymerase-3 subunit gamma/tau